METIFIGIAAYNETHLDLMISNCLENAEFPDRIYFGIWFHHTEGIVFDVSKYKNIKIVNLQYGNMLGVSVARLNAMALYHGEDYYLQLDSHMLFDKNWDTMLIENYKIIKSTYSKPIISTYTPWWSIKNNKIQHYSPINNAVCSSMDFDLEAGIKEKFPKPTGKNHNWQDKEYVEHYLVSGHFLFSDAQFITEILPDPLILFSGEEPTIAMRAWTRGYRIFCIKPSIVWHHNKGDGDQYKFGRLNYACTNAILQNHYMKKTEQALKRTKSILTGKILGYWGAPSLELLHDYEKACGVDFKEFYNKLGETNV